MKKKPKEVVMVDKEPLEAIAETLQFSPRRPMEMDFPNALREIIAGKCVTKMEWNDPNTYLVLKDNTLMLHKDDGFYPLIVTDGDLFGEDFVETRGQLSA